MATIEDLFAALKEADRAGDVEGATKLAQYISSLGYGPQIEPEKPAPKAGVTDYLKDIPKAIGRGAVGLLETSGIGAAAALPDEYETKAREFITGLATPAKEYLAPATPEIGQSIPSTLASGIGSTAPFFALGPMGLAGRLAATGLGTAAGAGEARIGAEQAGATPEERAKATALGAPTGLLDLIAPNIGPLKSLITTALARGGVEGATEAAQKVAQNMIAKGIYNPEQDVLAGSGEEGAYGAGVGALTSLIIDLALGRRAKAPKAGEQPPAAPQAPAVPEAPAVAETPTIAPPTGGFSAEDANRLRQEAAQAEADRQQAEEDRARLAEEERQQAMAATQERMVDVPGISGMPRKPSEEEKNIGIPEDLMGEIRRRQEKEAKAEQQRQQAEAERQRAEAFAQEEELRRQIDEVSNTTFSSDPVKNQIAKDRVLGQLRSELGRMTAARTRAEQAEPPKFEPITAPQEVPKGAKVTKFTPEEEAEIEGLKSNLTEVNKQIADAKKEKTSLFNRLKGELIYRPGAFGIKDIDSDNKSLKTLFNKQGKGRLLEDMVADGSLDDFLPERNRALIGGQPNPNFDANAAVEQIADKLRSRDYGSTVASQTIGQLEEEKGRIQQELDRLQTVPEVNLDLARQAAIPKAQEELVALPDLEADAQMKGVDTEALKERLAMANPNATPEQFLGFYRGALGAATSTSPSYEIGGYEYTAEELETSIAERLTDEEIDEYIRQAEAEQAAVAKPPKKPAPRGKAEPAPKGETEEEPVTAEPEEVKIPGARLNPFLSKAVINNNWDQVTSELEKSDNPIIANLGRMAKGLKGVTTEINPVLIKAVASRRAVAIWSRDSNGIYFKNAQYAGSEHAVAHEITHALTYFAVNNPRPDQKAAVKRLDNLYRFVKTKLKAEGKGKLYGLTDMDEFLSEANGNPDFQKELARIPYQKQTAWGAFTQAVADILGIKNSSALSEVLALTEELTTPASRKTVAKAPVEEKPKVEEKPGKPPELKAPAGFKEKKGRNTQVVLAARELAAGRITKQEYDRYVDYYTPVAPVLGDKLEAPIADNQMRDILTSKIKQKKKPELVDAPIADGTKVGLRMDIPALEWGRANGVNGSVVSIHRGTSPSTKTTGPNISYKSTGHIKNVVFAPRSEERAFGIAQGLEGPAGEKSPQQTIEGEWINTPPDRAFSMVKNLLNNPEWKQISLDPLRHSYFYDRANRQPVLKADEVLQVGRFVLAKNPVYGKREDFLYMEGKPSSVKALELSPSARDALEILEGQGRAVKPPEPGYIEKTRQSWNNAVQNPQLTKEQALNSFSRLTSQFKTWAFSSDAGLQDQIQKAIFESNLGQEQKIGILLNASLSQTVNSDAVANLFLMKGNVRWDEELKKWVGVEDKNNIGTLSGQLDAIAEKHGMTKEQIELIAHTAFEAKRTQSLIRENEKIAAKAEAMRAEAKRIRADSPVAASELLEKANRLEKTQKIIHLVDQDGNIDYEAIKAGMTQFEIFPELNDVVKTWDGIRSNALKVMVDTGLYSPEEAENLMANADYVPFFREDQIEEGKGPKEFLRSLSVQADKRMKGSRKPVNDIFDNMVRWTQYAINRGVRNRSAIALTETAEAIGIAEQVADPKNGVNVVRVWKNVPRVDKNKDPVLDADGRQIIDNKQVYYSMADPMFMSAFQGLESVSIPTIKFFSKFADVLRNSVVLFPLFSVSQVTQDSFAAMFSSGLKPQHALSIPFRAAKEFLQTLRGKSSTHEELKNVGAVGVRDFTSSIIRSEVEILSGLKKDKSLWDKVKRQLGNFAMAADNAVRQATYEAAIAQGLSRREAIEKAFEIFNVRRRGSSQMLAMAGQVIPFFNAYLAAQNVAYRTLTGTGTSPTERKAALETLAATTASVMALSMLYAMMMGDDEGYEKKPTPTRDRLLIIPGTNGNGIPLRSDLFLLPKALAEHTYHLLTDNGMTDPAKFRASLAAMLANSFLSPTVVPQAVKPVIEAAINFDFFQQQPLVGIYQGKKEIDRQFTNSTSEFSKALAKVPIRYNFEKAEWQGIASPIALDHVIRGMLGSFGGLFLEMTNPIIAGLAGTTRPATSIRDALNAIPNASAFISKEYEVGLRKDFYALKDVTDRAANTLSDYKQRNPEEIKAFLEDPKNKVRVGMAPMVNNIAQKLTEIRKNVDLITNIEDPKFTADRKEEEIKKLREMEYQLLKNINLRKLREMAQM
jgi:hypothetical protein